MAYTTTTAFLETLGIAGIEVCFVNLGSDHPSFMEAIEVGKAGGGRKGALPMPRFISVTHEMVALSACQGYYQATGKMAALILHVDCGLLNAGGAIHNVYRARCPVLVFTGMSSWTVEGELSGSRSEFINWVQDVHDQPGIVRQYSKFSYEIRTGRNVGQVTMRAAQIAMSEPRGPVYLFGGREVMEEALPLPAVTLNPLHWMPIEPIGLTPDAVGKLVHLLTQAQKPLVVTSWLGKDEAASAELLKMCESLAVPVLDHCPFALNFPTTHLLYQGTHWSGGGQHPMLSEADLIIVVDSDIPWIPLQNAPNPAATIVHIDIDPLKMAMPLFYIPSEYRYAAKSSQALRQINEALPSSLSDPVKKIVDQRYSYLIDLHRSRQLRLSKASSLQPSNGEPQQAAVALDMLRRVLPADTFLISEAISNYGTVHEHLQFTDSRRWATSGASSLGYGGGAAVGAKIGVKAGRGRLGSNSMVCCITGDGSYLFSVPSTVQQLATRCDAPVLTVILVNGGWKSPRLSTLLVHPNGYASKTTANDLGVGFGPRTSQPQYANLAVAAAGGPEHAWGGVVESGSPDMQSIFEEAVAAVKGGRSATLEIIIPSI